MEIKISVVIPTYRRAHLLQNCINALTSQAFNHSEYEVIIVSDGPDTDTEQLVKADNHYRTILKYSHLPEKKGPAAARNFGWKMANGKLIAFTDDDCIPDKNWLGAIWNQYRGEEKIAYSGTIKVPLPPIPTDFELNTSHLERAGFVTANCCCTKKALIAANGFDERFETAWREDSDLAFKLEDLHIPIVTLEDALVIHPVRKAKWGVSIKEQRKGIYNALLYKKFPKKYREKVQARPQWEYYLIVLSIIALITGLALAWKPVYIIALALWTYLQCKFIYKRLAKTSHSFSHVLEMIATSLIIPVASIYWQLYGAYKYKILFL